jgi:hypothetical protein
MSAANSGSLKALSFLGASAPNRLLTASGSTSAGSSVQARRLGELGFQFRDARPQRRDFWIGGGRRRKDGRRRRRLDHDRSHDRAPMLGDRVSDDESEAESEQRSGRQRAVHGPFF